MKNFKLLTFKEIVKIELQKGCLYIDINGDDPSCAIDVCITADNSGGCTIGDQGCIVDICWSDNGGCNNDDFCISDTTACNWSDFCTVDNDQCYGSADSGTCPNDYDDEGGCRPSDICIWDSADCQNVGG